jgi:cytochrome c-type biogenesis protein CcmE
LFCGDCGSAGRVARDYTRASVLQYPDKAASGAAKSIIMKHKAVKLGLTGVVLATAFIGLMYSTMSEGAEYYKHVDEVMTQPTDWYGKKLQLHGFIVADSVMVNRRTLEYRFKVQSNGKMVDARYTGVVPDTFKNDAEVVLKGTLDHTGFTVSPNGVMAKCPSKYEPQAAAASSGTR